MAETALAKERGTAAYKVGRFGDAVTEFSAAVDLCLKEDPAQLHLILSNRSAAYQQLKDFKRGAEDAHKCVQASPAFPKGWSHLGLCKFNLGLWNEAIAAYQKAAELDLTKASEYTKLVKAAEAAKKKAENGRSLFSSLASLTLLVLWMASFVFASCYLLSIAATDESWLLRMNRSQCLDLNAF
jgi:tetratricopeptide (TPR) repeat protein